MSKTFMEALFETPAVFMGVPDLMEQLQRLVPEITVAETLDLSGLSVSDSARRADREEPMILALPEPEALMEALDAKGLRRYKDYATALDLLEYLDCDLFRGKALFLLGSPEDAARFQQIYKWTEELTVLSALPEAQAAALPENALLLTSPEFEPLCDWLDERGIDFLRLAKMSTFSRVSDAFLQMYRDPVRRPGVCRGPFSLLRIQPTGLLTLCPGNKVSVTLGHIQKIRGYDYWNSYLARVLRLSILLGKYSFCDLDFCTEAERWYFPDLNRLRDHLLSHGLDHVARDIDEGQVRVSLPPASLQLSYDSACNLSCPSCRDRMFCHTGRSRRDTRLVTDAILRGNYLSNVSSFGFGNGEYFANQETYQRVVAAAKKNEGPITFALTTNGLLLTEERWDGLYDPRHSYGLQISIDAATEETYAKVRGGDFAVLKQRLQFAAELRKSRRIHFLEFPFVVQEANYREIPDFARMALSYGGDKVLFYRIGDWGSMRLFGLYDVGHPAHPHHADLLEVLGDEILTHPRVLLMRGLEQHREETPRKKTRVVLFGCSKKAEHLSSITPPFPIDYFVDDDSALWGTVFAGLPVRPPSALLEECPASTTVFIASTDYQPTSDRLRGMGFGDTSVMPL